MAVRAGDGMRYCDGGRWS